MTEYAYALGETYPSARATPELVGREKELKQIYAAIRDTSQSYVIYITGEGGIGKTRLVKHLLHHPPEDIEVVVAQDIIDFYHARVHSLVGFISALLDLVPPLADFINSYLSSHALDSLARAEQEGLSRKEALSRSKEVIELIDQFTQEHRLVLVFDTTERLVVEQDPVQKSLELQAERAILLEWLLADFFPAVQNIVVLWAGRPESGALKNVLEQQLRNVKYLHIALQGLPQDKVHEYMEAVAKSAEIGGQPQETRIAETIRSWSEEQQLVLFYCLHDETAPPTIRPILLALAIDHLSIEGRPLPKFSVSLPQAQSFSAKDRQESRDELGKAIVSAFRIPGRPDNEVITTLGWLRKGADAELLKAITGFDETEAQAALDNIKDLSFVKIRSADERIFLHDELYFLLQHARENIPDAARERVFQAIQDHYKQRIEAIRAEITHLYGSESTLPDTRQVALARAHLEDALVEDLHYRLRWDPEEGFKTYLRYAEEAVVSHDQNLDMQLRSELLAFLAEQDPSGTSPKIDGLSRGDVTADAAVRWVKRAVEAQQYEEALDIVKRLREDSHHLVEENHLIQAELNTWEGLAYVYLGDYQAAQTSLERASTVLTGLEHKISNSQLPQWCAIRARNYNNLGYLYRVQGRLKATTDNYQHALPYWRSVGIEAEQANTLTNLAYTLALIGQFETARHHAADALNLRKKLGTRAPLALTFNVLAGIEVQAGHYREAEPYAQRALQLSRALGFQRGEGLALLMLSDIHRFRAESPGVNAEEKGKLLSSAFQEAEAALNIFPGPAEPERTIEAWYQRGIAMRNTCLVAQDKMEACSVTAVADLNNARTLAEKEGLWPHYFDVSLGLAWTYYYTHSETLADLLQEIEDKLSSKFDHYRITKGKIPQIDETTVVEIFEQLARLQVLHGVLVLDAYEGSPKKQPYDKLREAVRYFTLALEYDEIIAPDAQGIRRALNTIHNKLKSRNNYEMIAIYEAIEETAKEFGLIKEDLRLWREMGEYGPYEVFQLLTK